MVLDDSTTITKRVRLDVWRDALGTPERVQAPLPSGRDNGTLHFYDSLGLYLVEGHGKLVSQFTVILERTHTWPLTRKVFAGAVTVFGVDLSGARGSPTTLAGKTPLTRTYPGLLQYRAPGFTLEVTVEPRLPKNSGELIPAARHPTRASLSFL